MHPHLVAGWVGDVAQAMAGVVIHRVRDVRQPQQRPGLTHDLPHAVAHVEGVTRHVHHADVGRVHPADHPDRRQPVLDPVVGVRVDAHVDALAFDDRQHLPSTGKTLSPSIPPLLRAPGESVFITFTPRSTVIWMAVSDTAPRPRGRPRGHVLLRRRLLVVEFGTTGGRAPASFAMRSSSALLLGSVVLLSLVIVGGGPSPAGRGRRPPRRGCRGAQALRRGEHDVVDLGVVSVRD